MPPQTLNYSVPSFTPRLVQSHQIFSFLKINLRSFFSLFVYWHIFFQSNDHFCYVAVEKCSFDMCHFYKLFMLHHTQHQHSLSQVMHCIQGFCLNREKKSECMKKKVAASLNANNSCVFFKQFFVSCIRCAASSCSPF